MRWGKVGGGNVFMTASNSSMAFSHAAMAESLWPP
jgi:hypothetical protein